MSPHDGDQGSILLVEDEEGIGRRVLDGLRAAGFAVRWHQTGLGALAEAALTPFDLVLLDLGLPDADGVEICRDLRLRQPTTVIVMLTARRDEMDAIVGLEAGADDYVTKPFALALLVARIRAHLRRQSAWPTPAPRFCDGDLILDFDARRCLVHGLDVGLRPKEFDLLARLAREPGQAVDRETLMADVWDANWIGSTNTLEVHVAALRRRLETARRKSGARLPTIATLRGYGYRFDPLDDGAGAFDRQPNRRHVQAGEYLVSEGPYNWE